MSSIKRAWIDNLVATIFGMKSFQLATILTILAVPSLTKPLGKRATCTTGTINSLSDVSAAQECSTVNINGFTVPAGEGFTLSLADGATVNLSMSIASYHRPVLEANPLKMEIFSLAISLGPDPCSQSGMKLLCS